MRATLALALVLALLSPVASAHSYAEARYVGAGAGACADTPHPSIDAGGGCAMQVHTGAARIVVTDDALGAVAFTWQAKRATGQVCAEGTGAGSADVVVPTGCDRVTVLPTLGSTGIVRITW